MPESEGGVREPAPAAVHEARCAFIEWVREGGRSGRIFLEIWIRAQDGDGFEIRHRAEREVPGDQLGGTTDPYAAREIAQTTQRGDHRPLKTSPNLRRGWALVDLRDEDVGIAMEYLYPAAVSHWHAGRQGTLRVTHWDEAAARQSGIYSAVGLLPPEAVRNTVQACCAEAVCMRDVAWGTDASSAPPPPAEGGADEARVPCPEPCSLFISLARKVLQVERVARRPVNGLGEINDLELDQLRAIALAAAEGRLDAVREGDFDDPRNSRRIRYLAARLRGTARREDESC